VTSSKAGTHRISMEIKRQYGTIGQPRSQWQLRVPTEKVKDQKVLEVFGTRNLTLS
jgi:hypothetical protein